MVAAESNVRSVSEQNDDEFRSGTKIIKINELNLGLLT